MLPRTKKKQKWIHLIRKERFFNAFPAQSLGPLLNEKGDKQDEVSQHLCWTIQHRPYPLGRVGNTPTRKGAKRNLMKKADREMSAPQKELTTIECNSLQKRMREKEEPDDPGVLLNCARGHGP